MTTRIEIDPNVRVGVHKHTYSGFEDVHGSITVGEKVEVYEPEADLIGEAEVIFIDKKKELVFLSVAWHTLHRRHDDPDRWP